MLQRVPGDKSGLIHINPMTFYTLGCVDLSRYSRNCFNDHPASFPVSWYLQVAFQDFGVHGLQTDVQTSLTFNIFQSRHLATSVCALQTSFILIQYGWVCKPHSMGSGKTWQRHERYERKYWAYLEFPNMNLVCRVYKPTTFGATRCFLMFLFA